ncbi:MAG: N-acetylmuramoyl-L-alanine amidase, partial [Pseudomonadota bacterium]
MLASLGEIVRKARLAWSGAIIAVLCGLVAVAASHAASPGSGVLGVRLGGDAAETRLVIDLDRGATARVSQDGANGRVVLSLPGVDARADLQGAGRGLIKAWMIDGSGGGARLQIDLNGQASIKRRFLLPPADGVSHYRYVIDIAAAGPPAASFTARPTRRAAAAP